MNLLFVDFCFCSVFAQPSRIHVSTVEAPTDVITLLFLGYFHILRKVNIQDFLTPESIISMDPSPLLGHIVSGHPLNLLSDQMKNSIEGSGKVNETPKPITKFNR